MHLLACGHDTNCNVHMGRYADVDFHRCSERRAAAAPSQSSIRPHDPNVFTQGLMLFGGSPFESVGLYGLSSLREVDPLKGEVLSQVEVPDEFFVEGSSAVRRPAYPAHLPREYGARL